MFEATLTNGLTLKKLIDAIKDMVSEANFECKSSGISLQAMDSSHVSLVAIDLPSSSFENYRCDRNIVLGINLECLSKILRTLDSHESVTLESQDNADDLVIKIEAESESRCSQFVLKLMKIDSESLSVQDNDPSVSIVLPSSELQRVCRDLSHIGDTVIISANKENVSFSTNSTLQNGSIKFSNNSSSSKLNIVVNSPLTLSFSLKFLSHFVKASSLSESVTINLNEEAPLMVNFSILDSGSLSFYLAPKIDDEQQQSA